MFYFFLNRINNYREINSEIKKIKEKNEVKEINEIKEIRDLKELNEFKISKIIILTKKI